MNKYLFMAWLAVLFTAHMAHAGSLPTNCDLNQRPTAGAEIRGTLSAGSNLVFDASSSTDPNNNIKTYLWIWGDGTSSQGMVADHVYAGAATFTVQLIVTDECRLRSNKWIPLTITNTVANPCDPAVNQAPSAAMQITFPLSRVGENFTFDGRASRDPEAKPLTYRWQFGDGTSAQGNLVTHVFQSAGEFAASLTVTDACGKSASAAQRLKVIDCRFNTLPVIGAIGAREAEVNERLDFIAQASDRDSDELHGGLLVNYAWGFGDGTTGQGKNVQKSYREAGDYSATLTVTDNCNGRAQKSFAVSVREPDSIVVNDPSAMIRITPDRPEVNDNISFSTDISKYPTSAVYVWRFSDGVGTYSPSFARKFAKPGENYWVSLDVYGSWAWDLIESSGPVSFSVESGLRLRGFVPGDLGMVRDLGLSHLDDGGKIAWVLGNDKLAVVDVTDPDRPFVVNEKEMSGVTIGTGQAIAATNDLVAVGVGYPARSGVYFFDAKRHDLLTPVAYYDAQSDGMGTIRRLAIFDNDLYVMSTFGIRVLDISPTRLAVPQSPRFLAKLTGNEYKSLRVANNLVFAGRAVPREVAIFEWADVDRNGIRDTLQEIGRAPTQMAPNAIAIDGSLMVVQDSESDSYGYGGSLVFFNITNPRSPVYLSRETSGGGSQFRGAVLMRPQGSSGPVELYCTQTSSLYKFDVTDPVKRLTKEVTHLPGQDYLHRPLADKGLLYMPVTGATLVIFDTNPAP